MPVLMQLDDKLVSDSEVISGGCFEFSKYAWDDSRFSHPIPVLPEIEPNVESDASASADDASASASADVYHYKCGSALRVCLC